MQVDLDINKTYKPLFGIGSRYVVLYGGAGSGKSYYVAQQYVSRFLAEKINLLVIRNTGKTNRDSTFALFRQIINGCKLVDKYGHEMYLSSIIKINSSDMRIRFNKNEIIFAGLDDVEKLKSITFSNGELSDIWIEEASEISEADFNQLDIRLRGKETRKQIFLTFNPIDVNHWLKSRFIDQPADNVTVMKTTYKDNSHLDDEYIRLLESYKDTDPYYYDVYCLGNWGVLGNTIFDANKISQRLQELPQPVKKGFFDYKYDGLHLSEIRFIESENGFVTIYQDPKKKLKYCIGGDTAGEGSDWFVGQVLSQDGDQVAVLRHQMDSDLYAKQIYCLGKYYNNALLTIEVNFDSHPIKELQRFGYHHMYIREQNDTALDKHKDTYGFKTDAWTRPHIIAQLVEIVREHTSFFNDKLTLEEMLTFVRNTEKKGRMEAKSGAHDDLVMAIAIAYEGMNQLKIRKKDDKPDPDPFMDLDDSKHKEFSDYWG